MQTISVTELRTKSPQLIKALKEGHRVKLIYRSRPIADIEPTPPEEKAKTVNIKKLQKLIKKLNFPKLTPKQADARYRRYLMNRYGKYLS